MNLGKLTIRTLFIAGLTASFCNASGAQADASAAIPQQALPNGASSEGQLTRAARLTFVAGSVRVQRSDNTGDDTAVLNMPLGEGTRILTGDYGEAEIEFEDGSVARLTPRSALTLNVLALDSAHIAHTELGLLGGLAYFELRKSPGYTWLVDAGGTRIAPLENLSLRVSSDDPHPIFAVLAGSAHIERPNAFQADVRAGETFRADASDATRYFLTPQLAQESWDSWNESRDRAAADAADKRTAARNDYAADQGYGWSDLDASGSWYNVPGTGQVWQPDNADEGFDPYGYGAWVWGNGAYVWASGYPWGWTPFRCGHWQYFNGFGWGWIPDLGCGQWAFAGGGYLGEFGRTGIFVRGPYPPRHKPVIRPFPRPGQPHPVVPVRGPDGPRPWTPHPVVPPPPARAPPPPPPPPGLGSGLLRNSHVPANALALDYPVDRKTHQPIIGAVPASPSSAPVYGNAAPSSPGLEPGIHRPHLADAPGAATSWRQNPAPSQGTAPGPIPNPRPGPVTSPTTSPLTPRPNPAPTEPRPTPIAPVRQPSAAPPPSRPASPPPAPPSRTAAPPAPAAPRPKS